ncbi:Fungalysin/Thermolysin Extracellular metalloproteinase 5, partial [Tulasnella sp. 427]
EGWGDFTAVLVWMTGAVKREEKDALDRDYTVAGWVANKTEGVRRYPYSRNMTTNPSTYRTMNEPQYWNVHQIGEVWAQMLFIVLHVLIEKHGIGDTLFPPQPHANGTFMFPNSFYDPPNVHARSHSRPILKHGNTLFFQLLVDGMKLQPCETDFFSARDAILQADENLTGGENVCDIWKGFAGRGLGPFARFKLIGPWRDRKERTNDFSVPVKCGGTGKPDDGE